MKFEGFNKMIVLEKNGSMKPYSDWDKANADVLKGWKVRINKTGKKLGKKETASKGTKAKK